MNPPMNQENYNQDIDKITSNPLQDEKTLIQQNEIDQMVSPNHIFGLNEISNNSSNNQINPVHNDAQHENPTNVFPDANIFEEDFESLFQQDEDLEIKKMRFDNEELKREIEMIKKEKQNKSPAFLICQLAPLQGKKSGSMFLYNSYDNFNSFDPRKEIVLIASELFCAMVNVSPHLVMGRVTANFLPRNFNEVQFQSYENVKKQNF